MKNRKKINYQSGFTLIETIIYIVLFAFIMTSTLVSVYSLLGSAARNEAKAKVQEEGSFLLSKIDYVLIGIKTINEPNDGSSITDDFSDTLRITKFDGATIIEVSLSGTNLEIDTGAGVSTLNNSNVTITCPIDGCFKHTSSSGDGINPEQIEANFTVNAKTSEGLSFSQDFSTIKYLRK